MYSLADRRGLGTYPARPFHTMLVSPRPFRVKVRCCFNHFATSGLRLRNKRRCASMAHFSDCPFPNPPGSFHCNGLSSFQKPLRTVWKRITRQQPLPFCTPCHPFPYAPLSGAPWRGVTPASTTMALYPFCSRREGYPAFSRIRRASAW